RGLTAAEAVVKLAEIHDGLGAAATSSPPSTEQSDSAYSRALAGLTAPMPGAQERVAAMSGTIPVAVASNGRGEDVRGLLERAGMLHLFDEVVTIDDVADGKPGARDRRHRLPLGLLSLLRSRRARLRCHGHRAEVGEVTDDLPSRSGAFAQAGKENRVSTS